MRRLLVRHGDERGASMVEFALVLPVFLLLLFGLFDVGRLVYVNNAVSEAAREGARWGSVAGRSNSSTGVAGIKTQTVAAMPGVTGAVITVSCRRDGAATSTCRSRDTLVVKVENTVRMTTPGIAQLLGNVQVSSTAQVAVNQ